MHQRIARHLQQCTFSLLDAPEQRVTQGIALRITMTDHVLDHFDDTARQHAGRCIGGNVVTEQRRAALRVPRHVVWRDLRCQQPAGGITKAGNVRAWI